MAFRPFSRRERKGIIILLSLSVAVIIIGFIPSFQQQPHVSSDTRPLYRRMIDAQRESINNTEDNVVASHTCAIKDKDSIPDSRHRKKTSIRRKQKKSDGKQRKSNSTPSPAHDPFAPVPATKP